MADVELDVGSWRLKDGIKQNAQGLIVSPFAHLPEGLALLLDATNAKPGWLKAVTDKDAGGVAITAAIGRHNADAARGADGCAAIALTAGGLRQLGVGDDVLSTFAPPFVEGMHELNRRHRLGDDNLCITSGARWTGAPPDAASTIPARQVHALLLLYHATREQLDAYAAPVRAVFTQFDVSIANELQLSLQLDTSVKPPLAREHFGFADGISQPVPYGAAIVTKQDSATGQDKPYPQDPIHGIPAGDLLLGHTDSNAEVAPGPVVAAGAPHADLLPPLTDNQGLRDLGSEGSYLVVRELSQDVEAFWDSMKSAAAQIGAPDEFWIAEKVVGRTRNGVVLAANPPPNNADGPGNDFLFWKDDADGRHCPLGSHVRRANPRDGLAPSAGATGTLLTAANHHRILRRGRKYGAYEGPGLDKKLPGLLFMCLNTDLERQFEFVQQTWMLNRSFAALINEQDPLLGPKGCFTIPEEPIRRRPALDTFIRFVGGEYFFLPSMSAIDYLAALSA